MMILIEIYGGCLGKKVNKAIWCLWKCRTSATQSWGYQLDWLALAGTVSEPILIFSCSRLGIKQNDTQIHSHFYEETHWFP